MSFASNASLKTEHTASVQVISAFVREGRGGNPAGFCLIDEALPDEVMQGLATEAGYPETVFVRVALPNELHVRFFTPAREIAFCGHATVGAAALLRERGILSPGEFTIVTPSARIPLRIESEGSFIEFPAPEIEPYLDGSPLLASLGLSSRSGEIESVMLVSGPVRFIHLRASSPVVLAEAKPDMEALAHLSAESDVVGVYLSVATAGGPEQFETRMFAPYYGIPEESATGMGAYGLTALVASEAKASVAFAILQGHLMTPPSPSLIRVRAEYEEGKIKKVFVGGVAQSNE